MDKKTSIDTPRSHPAVARYKEKIYLFGGGGQDFSSLELTTIYDPSPDIWIKEKYFTLPYLI